MTDGITIDCVPNEVGAIAIRNAVRMFTGKTSAPTVDDDITLGYLVSDIWLDETNDNAYICIDNTDGAAVWSQVSGVYDSITMAAGGIIGNDVKLTFDDTLDELRLSGGDFNCIDKPINVFYTLDNAFCAGYNSYKSRNGSDVQDGDEIGKHRYYAYANGAYAQCARIVCKVDGNPVGSWTPSKYIFSTFNTVIGDDFGLKDTLVIDSKRTTTLIGSTNDGSTDVLRCLDLDAAEILAIDSDGNLTLSGTVDGRDVATDGSKLDGIETGADVTDFANVQAALAAASGAVDFNSQNITGAGTISGTTAKLSSLTDGYIPYHVDDATGLADSVIQQSGTKIGIGTTPTYKLHIVHTTDQNLDPAFQIEHNYTSTANNFAGFTFHAPLLGAGKSFSVNLGKEAATKNRAQLKFKYAGSGSSSNAFYFDFYGTDPILYMTAGGSIGINESSPETMIESTGAAPYLTLHNDTHEDTDGGRESRIIAKGEQSGGEETTLGYIEFAHDGAADDQKGLWRVLLNDGNDGTSPSVTAISMLSDGSVDVPGDFTAGSVQADNGYTGSWINSEGNTVTVVGGIITGVA
jgi:hypothetical protein